MKIKSVKMKKYNNPVFVYDISVDRTKNFCLGNGCVVHNSKDVADAVAGCVYKLSLRKATFRKHGNPPTLQEMQKMMETDEKKNRPEAGPRPSSGNRPYGWQKRRRR